ncbi:putative secreted protein [Granulibacter bethesdensis]|nr:putative secreted protein [Granulibacter bethesdensis]
MRISSRSLAAFAAAAFSLLPILPGIARAEDTVSHSDLASVQRSVDDLSHQTSESISNLRREVSSNYDSLHNEISSLSHQMETLNSEHRSMSQDMVDPRSAMNSEVSHFAASIKEDILKSVNAQNARRNTATPDQATINKMVKKALTDNPALLRAALASLKQGSNDETGSTSRTLPASK